MEEMVGVPFFHFHFYFVPLPSMRNNSRCPRRISYRTYFGIKFFKKVSEKFGSVDGFLYICGMLNN
jgi:hypothetical protein